MLDKLLCAFFITSIHLPSSKAHVHMTCGVGYHLFICQHSHFSSQACQGAFMSDFLTAYHPFYYDICVYGTFSVLRLMCPIILSTFLLVFNLFFRLENM